MEKETIYLTEEELENFDFTGGYEGTTWELRNETYEYVEEIRTDEQSDGPSWEIVVKRKSDGKYFKWDCWDSGHGYKMGGGDNYMEETFPEVISKTIYK